MPRPTPQSPLRAPLNEILGTEANVRLLRVLALSDIPLGAGELALRAQLGRTGVYPAIASLERIGIVEFVGAGSGHQVVLRTAHPMASSLVALYQAESKRLELMIATLRKKVGGLKHVTSAWLKENHDNAIMQGDPDFLTFYVVSDPQFLSRVVDLIEADITELEHAFQVHFEILPLSRSEVSRIGADSLDDIILLAGVPPKGLLESFDARPARNRPMHADQDARSLLLAKAVAAKLRRDPSLVGRITATITERLDAASEQERRELREWLRVVSTMSPSKLQRFLVDSGDRAVRLRQSLPAIGLLTAREREEILDGQTEIVSRTTRPQ